MPKRHGRETRVWVAGVRLSADLVQIDNTRTVDIAPINCLEDDDGLFVAGAMGANIPFQGIFNWKEGAETIDRVDDLMNNLIGLGTDLDILIIHANIQGGAGRGMAGAINNDYTIRGDQQSAVAVTGAFIADGPVRRVVVVDAYATVTVATDGTTAASLDLGVAQVNSTFYIQCDFLNGGTLTVIPYHGLADLVEGTPFGTAVFTVPGGTAFRIEGGVDQFFMTVSTVNGGSAAFVTAVSHEVTDPD